MILPSHEKPFKAHTIQKSKNRFVILLLNSANTLEVFHKTNLSKFPTEGTKILLGEGGVKNPEKILTSLVDGP